MLGLPNFQDKNDVIKYADEMALLHGTRHHVYETNVGYNIGFVGYEDRSDKNFKRAGLKYWKIIHTTKSQFENTIVKEIS